MDPWTFEFYVFSKLLTVYLKIEHDVNNDVLGDTSDAEALADELGCKVRCLPSTYLRLPLWAPAGSVTVWDGVKERFRKRLGLRKH